MKTKKKSFLPTLLVNSLRLHGHLAITLSCGLAALVSSQSAFAAPRIWSGTSGVSWSTGGAGGNWTGLAAPVAADTLTFAGTTNTTTNNDLAANTSFGTISFTNTLNGQSFILGGNSITLGGAITTTATAAATDIITDTISLNMILSATRTVTTNTRHNLTISGNISESSAGFGITKAGAATLNLTGANSFSGPVNVNGGFLTVNSIADTGTSALGTGALTLTSGQFTFLGDSGSNTSTSRAITLAGSTTINTAASGTTAAASSLTLAGTFTTNTGGAKSITFAGGNTGANTVSSLLANATDGSVLTVVKNGGGNWALTNANNSFTGAFNLNQGTLTVSSIKDGGTVSNIGAGTSIRFGNAASTGILIYTGGVQSTNRTVQIGNNSAAPVVGDTGGATIQNDGAGLLTFSATTFNTAADAASGVGANRVLTLRGSNDGKISGTIQNNTVTSPATGTATIGVTKEGAGTWTLEGANTYSGATIVSGGTLTISGSRNVAAGAITVGGAATTSVLNLQNTGTYNTGAITMGTVGSTSTVNQSAGAITTSGSGLIMGNQATPTNTTYALSGGSLTSQIIMGVNTPTGGPHVTTFNLSGTGSLTSSTLRIGRYDLNTSLALNSDNTFAQSGGTGTVTNLGLGGNTADASGTNPIIAKLNLTGGTFSATNFASLSAGGANTSTILIGGTAQVTLPAFPTNKAVSSTATITFDTDPSGSGFLAPHVASTTYMPAGTFNNAYLSANGANFKVASGKDITIGQVLENKLGDAGKLTKGDAGMLTLTSASTYTGATAVTGGTLQMGDASTDTFATSGVTVDSGAKLGGSGTISGTVGVTGILAPGIAGVGGGIGTLAAGTTTWNGGPDTAATIWQFDLGVSSSDRLDITGDFTKGTAGTYKFDFMGSTPTWGATYTLIDWSGITNFENDASDFSFTGLAGFSTSYFTINGSQLDFTAVPEPTSAFAGLLITAGLLRRRRRA